MSELRKYKQVAAIVLLAVYAFITTPIQLWHHHDYVITAAASSLQQDNTTKISSSDSSTSTIEDNCQICRHLYSFYINDDVTVFKIFRAVINTKEGVYAHTIPLAPYFSSTDRGPPAIA